MNFSTLFIFSTVISLVPIIISFFFWNKQPKELRILTFYLVVGLMFSTVMWILGSQKINNLWMMHLFTPIQFGLLMWIFSFWFKGPIRRVVLLSIPVFTLFWVVVLMFFESFSHFNTYTRPVEALILIIVAGHTLYKTNKEDAETIFRMPRFWVASGTLIYFSGMILLYAVSNNLLAMSMETLRMVWLTIQTTSQIMSNLLFIGGFLCLSPRLHLQQ